MNLKIKNLTINVVSFALFVLFIWWARLRGIIGVGIGMTMIVMVIRSQNPVVQLFIGFMDSESMKYANKIMGKKRE